MSTRGTQTIYFTCPGCNERFAQTEDWETEIHTEEIYHCSSCGERVVFQAVAFDEYVPPPPARRDCHLCNPEPRRFGVTTKTNMQGGKL